MNLPPVSGQPPPPYPPVPPPFPPAAPSADPYEGDIRHWDAATRAPFMQHRLVPFDTAGAVILGIITLNIFPVIYHGLKHSRLPRVRHDDFTAGKAIGFLFIPFYNFYWVFVFWKRLAQRINFQFRLRDRPAPVSEELGTAIAYLTVLSFIPYLGMVTAAVNWLILVPILSAQVQGAANRLAAAGFRTAAAQPPAPADQSALPPVPPALAPPPPDGAPPPPPPPVAPPQISRRTLAWIGGSVAVLIIALVIGARLEAPTDSAVKSFVRVTLAAEGFDLDNVWVNRREKEDKAVTYGVNYTFRRSPESRYEALLPEMSLAEPAAAPPTGGVSGGDHVGGLAGLVGVSGPAPTPGDLRLPDWLPLDLALWRRVRTQLAGPSGPRLRQAAGLTPEEESLLTATLVREIKEDPRFASGLNNGDGTVRAVRRGLLWDFTFTRPAYAGNETGQRRRIESFRGKVLVLDRAEDRAVLLDLAHRLPGISDKLTRAVSLLLAEKKSSWLALLKPQALFAGTVEVQTYGKKQKATIYLEVTEARGAEDPPRLSALLRNDGGWQDSRLFAGRIVYDDPTGRFQLKLTSPAGEGDRGTGPFLDDNAPGFNLNTDEDGDKVLPFLLEDNALIWRSGNSTLRLEPVREDARATLVASLQADDLKLREATRPGKAYLGTITNRAKGTKETWLLRFTEPDEKAPSDEDSLTATLEHQEKRAWKSTLRGNLFTNRYRANGRPVRLQQYDDADLSPPKEITDLFKVRDNSADGPAIGLRLETDKLTGENSRFVFQFAPAASEAVAVIEQKWAEAAAAERRQLLDATRPGLIYRGAVTTRSGSRREEFLLRFVSPGEGDGELPSRARHILRGAGVSAPSGQQADGVLRAYLEHPDHPSWRRLLSGQIELDAEQAENLPIRLTTQGTASNGAEARTRSFLDANHEELQLRTEGLGLTGESGEYRYHFERAAPDAVTAWQRRDAAIQARLREFAQPGAEHDGAVSTAKSGGGSLRLRFLKFEDNGARIEAALYSRANPRFAALLTGSLRAAEHCLQLQFTHGARPAGATDHLFEAPELAKALQYLSRSASLDLYWDGEVVGGYSGSDGGGWAFRFEPSSPEKLAQIRQEAAAREARLLALVQEGAVLEGTVERKGMAAAGPLRLRVESVKDRGERVAVRVQSPAHPRYQLQAIGSCDLSAGVLRLQWQGAPDFPARSLAQAPDFPSHLRNTRFFSGSLALALEESPITGTRDDLVFRFQPAAPARLAELQKEEADRLARALAFMQAGTEHEGTLARPGGPSARVRLRILSRDDRDERIVARLESAQLPQHAQKLTGRLALGGQLLLARLDRVPAEATGRLLSDDPALQGVFPGGYYTYNEFELAFTDSALEGGFEGNSAPKFSFPLR